MKSQEIRKKFLNFFKEKQHAVVPSCSLMPDDPSVLLTTAGMQQFKPYYTGKADAMRDFNSLNTASVQKSFRTSDIDEVGDETHLTFFEMLGNFSFGGYFKEGAIKFAYDLVKEYGLIIQYVTIFEGNSEIPRDDESEKIWRELGVKDIRQQPKSENFWGPTGSEGPCGPTTEIFINNVEVWNIVFNEYYCSPRSVSEAGSPRALSEVGSPDNKLEKLKTPGVDTGMGLERLAVALQDKEHIFETDLFAPILELLPQNLEDRKKRIITDHVRGFSFLISDGVRPSNKEAGYVLRRLMRRVITSLYIWEQQTNSQYSLWSLFEKIVQVYGGFYQELNLNIIKEVFSEEDERFRLTLGRGLKELEKLKAIDTQSAFKLYESYGLPYEVIKEVGGKHAEKLTREDFDKKLEHHKETSRAGSEAKFGGHGLMLDTGELKAHNEEEIKIVTRLHTATHLLQAALQVVLGKNVKQDGSDITAERLRFDFTFDRRLTDEEIKQIEDWINDKIKRGLSMSFKNVLYEDAIQTGALFFAKEKYPATVKVYTVIDENGKPVSSELCGGPPVENTKELVGFKIKKQESVGAGVKRIRAVVADIILNT